MRPHGKCCNACIESLEILSCIQNVLNGEEVSDFAMSFREVREIADLVRELRKAEAIMDIML